MLGKSKFNSIEILISQILIDLEISHKEFKKIVNEKGKYGKMKKKKKKIRMMKSNDEIWIKWI